MICRTLGTCSSLLFIFTTRCFMVVYSWINIVPSYPAPIYFSLCLNKGAIPNILTLSHETILIRTTMFLKHRLHLKSHQVINFFLQLILNVSNDILNHLRGMRLLSIKTLLAKAFRPTFFVFALVAMKLICLDVKIWLKFNATDSVV